MNMIYNNIGGKMEREYIDVFDENNNPIGEIKEKQQAHEDGNFHRTAHVWIIKEWV